MEYTITPLTPHTGAEVRGIDLNQGVDAETRAALNRAFAEHHVLVVRGQQFTRRNSSPRARGGACLSESLTRNVAANFNKVSSPPRKRGPRACPWQEQGATGRTLAAPGFPLSRE
jgi:alpha-ketoglutarate-dependent taurine dioxygenase